MGYANKDNIRTYCMDQVDRGNLTTDEANVLMVQMEGVRVVTKLPSQVRRALNAAVKRGDLGHIKADGLKPEVYFHANSRPAAITERERIFKTKMQAIGGVFGWSKTI